MTNSRGETFVSLSQENHTLKGRVEELEVRVQQLQGTLAAKERELEQQTSHMQPPTNHRLHNRSSLQDIRLQDMALQDIEQFQAVRLASPHYTNTVIRNSTSRNKPHPSTTTPHHTPTSRPLPAIPLSPPANLSFNKPDQATSQAASCDNVAMMPHPTLSDKPTPPKHSSSIALPNNHSKLPPLRPLRAITPPSPQDKMLALSTNPQNAHLFKPTQTTPPSVISMSPVSLPPTPPSTTPPQVTPQTLPHKISGQKNIQLQWHQEVYIGAHMVRGSTAYNHEYTEVYLSCPHSQHVHSYSSTTGQWSRYQPKCPHLFFSVTIALGLVTAVGGQQGREATPKLLSLLDEGDEEGGGMTWRELLPPMPTARLAPTTATLHPGTTEERVLVLGGVAEQGHPLDSAEVLHIQSRQWSEVASLPHPADTLSCTFASSQLYLMGGSRDRHTYTCSIHQLLANSATPSEVWQQLPDTPTQSPSGIVIDNQLLAVGGFDEKGTDSAAIFHFHTASNSWRPVSTMKRACNKPLLANIPRGTLMIIGGSTKVNHVTNIVQSAEISCT